MHFETLFIGLVIAVLFVELTDLYPGGIIVPAYFAMVFDQPLRMVATLVIAFIALAVYRGFSRFFIVFGKRRFVLLILIGAVLSQLWFLMQPHIFRSSFEMQAIGWIIPGLLANNLEKQKIVLTLISLFTVAAVTYAAVRVLNMTGL